MSLIEGHRLGSYTILGSLGGGGMGQVYRARDARLGREVAIKILQPRFAADPEWLARFEREARLLAAFSHPGIATIHGLEEEAGQRYLIMELVPGETLAQRQLRDSLPVAEALDICRQVAEALEAAHERDIIHRDLKPGNIMLTPEGRVKVLDFGLARKTGPAGSMSGDSSETQAHDNQTSEGAIVGTPAYMAPEQARGQKVDRCCDVWAFGCLLYELLSGEQPFVGPTNSDIFVAVLEREPRWASLPPTLPPRLVELMKRCLKKDARKRMRDIRDVRLELEEGAAEIHRGTSATAPGAPPKPRRWLFGLAGCAAIALGVLLGTMIPKKGSSIPPEPIATAPLDWVGDQLTGGSTVAFGPRISPNRKWLAFGILHDGQTQVGFMNLATGEWFVRTSDKTRGLLNTLSWTRQGDRVYFDRFFDQPGGIYLASPPDAQASNEPRLVPNAECPQVLSNGHVFFCRPDRAGRSKFYTIEQGGEDGTERSVFAHAVEMTTGWPPASVRALHNRPGVVFCGKLFDGKDPTPKRRLYLLDLETGKHELLHSEPFESELVPLALSHDDQFVYTVLPARDIFRMVRIPIGSDRSGGPQTVWTTTHSIFGMDVDEENQIYLVQFPRPREMLRFPLTGGRPERVAGIARGHEVQPIQLPDDRLVLPGKVLGRDRLFLALPNKDALPLLSQDAGESRPPVALVGKDLLGFVHKGRDGKSQVKLATFAQGDVPRVRTIPDLAGDDLNVLASSPAGDELYFVRGKKVYRVPVTGGAARELADGDALAVHPTGKKLLVQRFADNGVRLNWVPLDGGKSVEVKVRGDARLAPYPLGAGAMDAQGRVLVAITSPRTWFWQTAVLRLEADETAGTLEPIPVEYEGDISPANWAKGEKEAQILGMGYPLRSELWRLTPVKGP